MKYSISYKNPHQHLVDIAFVIDKVDEKTLLVQLPAWRPGRYELSNFAQNVKSFEVTNAEGKKLAFKKKLKDLWEIETHGSKTVHVNYSYYANELNAGSTYLDENQLYINPVNCCLYVPNRIDAPAEIELDLPTNYKVATGLTPIKKNKYKVSNFHELADSPLIASATLQHDTYDCKGVTFHIWFQGEIKPNWEKLKKQFLAYTTVQLKAMKSFPFTEYHFLYQIDTKRAYHGVEHLNSTVIYFGPSYEVSEGDWYDEFLGVSSHELFHAWNIKTIRPIEMMPYDYNTENYSRLGYVAEGVTTYYGDVFLLRSKVYDEKRYFKTFNQLLDRHFSNFGRFNLSVADSSFDTWLDGYKAGVPGRKTSIYTEGALCAFMVDVQIRRDTKNKKSLDDVMRLLYNEYGKKQVGYTEGNYREAIEAVSGTSFKAFFKNYYEGTKDYEPLLKQCLDYLGLDLKKAHDNPLCEQKLGVKTIDGSSGSAKIALVFPGSVADLTALQPGDEIVAINGIVLNKNLNEWLKYFKTENKVSLTVLSGDKDRQVEISFSDKDYFLTNTIEKTKKPSKAQQANYKAWSGV